MSTTFSFGAAFLLLTALAAAADEEKLVPPVSLFALPGAAPKKQETIATPSPESKENAASDESAWEELSLIKPSDAIVISESRIQSFEAMNGISILVRPEPAYEPGGAAGWLNEYVWGPVFAPEIVKLGKVQVSGGVVAALVRKNPFCLLHPLVFVASW